VPFDEEFAKKLMIRVSNNYLNKIIHFAYIILFFWILLSWKEEPTLRGVEPEEVLIAPRLEKVERQNNEEMRKSEERIEKLDQD
jgi:hypothetical protein